MEIRAAEISDIIKRQIQEYERELEVRETGRVLSTGDGIARIYGLDKVMAGELLEFPHGVFGLVLNLEEDNVGAAIMGEAQRDQGRRRGPPHRPHRRGAGRRRAARPRRRTRSASRSTARARSKPASTRRIELKAPGIVARQPVKEPLQTGIKAIDAMIPIGRGQRELIIGDRQTGKTAVALDTIINQKGSDVHLHLRRDRPEAVDGRPGGRQAQHASARWTTPSSSPPPPPSRRRCSSSRRIPAARMGEYFRDNGKHALVDLRRSLEAARSPTASCRCCCAVRRAAKRIPATSSTCTRAARARRQDGRREAAAAR